MELFSGGEKFIPSPGRLSSLLFQLDEAGEVPLQILLCGKEGCATGRVAAIALS
jgi:hypothetical protein